MLGSTRMERRLRELHGADVQFTVFPKREIVIDEPLAGRGFRAMVLVLAMVALSVLGCLLAAVAVGLAWLFGVAFFGSGGGVVLAALTALLAVVLVARVCTSRW